MINEVMTVFYKRVGVVLFCIGIWSLSVSYAGSGQSGVFALVPVTSC
jgi:hypothetical protein